MVFAEIGLEEGVAAGGEGGFLLAEVATFFAEAAGGARREKIHAETDERFGQRRFHGRTRKRPGESGGGKCIYSAWRVLPVFNSR